MEISYKLEKFEGPLDLLLHLIEKDKINIYDIPIVHITKQYMEYMENIQIDDLDTMSDFLVMAATLLDIKAKMLLPKEDKEDKQEEDPRRELVERLIEHKKYKLMAKELADREFNSYMNMFKNPTIPKEVQKYEAPIDLDKLLNGIDLAMLKNIFEEVIKKKNYRIDPERSKFGNIKRESISLKDRIFSLVEYARQFKRFNFSRLLKNKNNKTEVVVTFLAVLELMKMGSISIKQEEQFSDIEMELIADGPELDLSKVEDL